MKICNKCQTEYPDDMAFCSRCGIPLRSKVQEAACPACGKLLGKEALQFCPYCGQKLNSSKAGRQDLGNIKKTETVENNTADTVNAKDNLEKTGGLLSKSDLIICAAVTVFSTLATQSVFGFMRGLVTGLMFVFVKRFFEQKRYAAMVFSIIVALVINVGLSYALGSAPKISDKNAIGQNGANNSVSVKNINSNAATNKVAIIFPTGAEAGVIHSVGLAITNNWNKTVPSIVANVQPTRGQFDNLEMLTLGKAHVTIVFGSHAFHCMNNSGYFKGYGYKDLKAIAGMYATPNQFVVANKSGITRIADIKGKRFAVGKAGSTVYNECDVHFTAAGINFPNEIRPEFSPLKESLNMVQNGSIDGALIVGGVPVSMIVNAMNANCRLLNVSDELIEKLRQRYPWYVKYTIRAGAYPNQKDAVNTTATKMVMVCRHDLNDDTVYQLTKNFWNHINELKQTNVNLYNLKPNDAVKDIADIPLHPGAARYYKEIGVL